MIDNLKSVIDFLRKQGVDYADARFVHTLYEEISVKNGKVIALNRGNSRGVGIRVLWHGAWGFAATCKISEEELNRTAKQALLIAKASAKTIREPIKLTQEVPYIDNYVTKIKKDPFEIPLDDKLNLLFKADEIMRKFDKVKVAQSNMGFWKTEKIFVNTEGAQITQTIYESGGGISVTAVDAGELQKRSYPNSFGGDFATRGYEFIEEIDLPSHAEWIAQEACELLKAKDCPSGQKTIIIGGAQLALQVHESCGHPAELDRVLGYEASYAGTSFMTLDKLGKLRYGSKIVNIVQDATIEGALGSFGYDDEGVKASRTYIIKDGILVGYLMSRETAHKLGLKSNGTMRADGWWSIPLIRMTSINLEPGEPTLDELISDTKNGLFIDINKSWSIDDKRLNFQFGCEYAREIKNGKLGQLYKNPVYTGITPEFWNSCDAICNKKEWHVWGLPNCGKGEPPQMMHVSHGTAPARFRNVEVGVKRG